MVSFTLVVSYIVSTFALSECQVHADIAFVIDNSGSIRDKNPEDQSYDNYNLLKQFVKDILARLDIGPETTRVGAVRFSTQARLMFNLVQYNITYVRSPDGHVCHVFIKVVLLFHAFTLRRS